ncbi:UNVERIFIED_CONTAM: hypothetical protein ABID98_005492 [Brevibacillus sp. OAP136]
MSSNLIGIIQFFVEVAVAAIVAARGFAEKSGATLWLCLLGVGVNGSG